jgi:hypothetical protein
MAAKHRPYDWGLTEVDMPSKFVTDRKLWLTADKSEVVEDGDPRAAFLLASAGKEIDAETAERYGLSGKAKGGKPNAEAKAVTAPPENKAVKAPAATKGKE